MFKRILGALLIFTILFSICTVSVSSYDIEKYQKKYFSKDGLWELQLDDLYNPQKKQMEDVYYVYAYWGEETDITLPESLILENDALIVPKAFSMDNKKIKHLTIPDNYLYTYDFGIAGCTSLETISFSQNYTEIHPFLHLGNVLCSTDINLKSIELPNIMYKGNIINPRTGKPEEGVLLGYNMFYDCRKLTDIKFPSNVTVLGAGFFEKCSSLKTLKIPDTVTLIDEHSFFDCSSLEELYLPPDLNWLDTEHFGYVNNDNVYVANQPSSLKIYMSSESPAYKTFNDGIESLNANPIVKNRANFNVVNATPAKEKIAGDVNADGKFNIRDVTSLQKYLVKLLNDNDVNTELLDYNNDNKVNINDATAMQRTLAKMTD